MPRGRPTKVGKTAVSVRVLLSRADYEALQKIAAEERTDVGSLVRRAVARYFFVAGNGNDIIINR